MKRPANSQNNLERIQAWRKICPELTIRSTFIVGFPGETEAEFMELLDFLETAELDRVGCFKYSPVEGAKANDLPNPIPEEIKQERWEKLMACQARISEARLRLKMSKTLQVLVDEVNEKGAIGRSSADAPEIDGKVYITDNSQCLRPGDWAHVKVEHTDAYDVWGRLVE
jgi:ribosomal protein S12 methylthiotransferase